MLPPVRQNPTHKYAPTEYALVLCPSEEWKVLVAPSQSAPDLPKIRVRVNQGCNRRVRLENGQNGHCRTVRLDVLFGDDAKDKAESFGVWVGGEKTPTEKEPGKSFLSWNETHFGFGIYPTRQEDTEQRDEIVVFLESTKKFA